MGSEPYDTASHAELGLMQGFPPEPDKQVTRVNGLWQPPYNRWAFQNFRSLLPTRTIGHAAQPTALQRALDPGIEELTVSREDGSASDFRTYLREAFVDSFTVLHKGTVVYETYLNSMTPATPHIMFSCTKSFVGLWALMAIEQGLISDDTPVTDLIPEAAGGGAFGDIQLGYLLDMTNAMVFNEEYEASGSDITRYASVFGMGEAVPDAPGSLYELLLGLQRDPSRADGAVFIYQTATTEMINWALNRATGRGFAGFVQDDLWSRLGTEGETFVIVDPKGAPMAGGGLNATAPDIARFAAMMLDGGQFDGHQIVPQQVIDTVRAGASTKAFEAGGEAVGTMTDPQWSYRAQWWIRRSPGREAIMAIGIHGQWIYIDHDRQVAVIQQASQPEASTVYFSDYTFHAIDAVVDYLAGKGG